MGKRKRGMSCRGRLHRDMRRHGKPHRSDLNPQTAPFPNQSQPSSAHTQSIHSNKPEQCKIALSVLSCTQGRAHATPQASITSPPKMIPFQDAGEIRIHLLGSFNYASENPENRPTQTHQTERSFRTEGMQFTDKNRVCAGRDAG